MKRSSLTRLEGAFGLALIVPALTVVYAVFYFFSLLFAPWRMAGRIAVRLHLPTGELGRPPSAPRSPV
jgi:hypothetical protein